MSIDLKNLIRLWPDSRDLFPPARNGKPISKSTAYRRVNDPRNPLEVVKCGGSLYTTEEAIVLWIERETQLSGRVAKMPQDTPGVKKARDEATKRRLKAHGI